MDDLAIVVSKSVACAVVILCSELGDRTFFISMLMSMKHGKSAVFVGAIMANFAMAVVSAFLGFLLAYISQEMAHVLSILLFTFFGLRMISEGISMTDDVHENKLDDNGDSQKHTFLWVAQKTFMMICVGELGDKSQIATAAMASSEGLLPSVLGVALGHLICTTIAVFGGTLIASKISTKTVTIIGGNTFLIFAIWTFVSGT